MPHTRPGSSQTQTPGEGKQLNKRYQSASHLLDLVNFLSSSHLSPFTPPSCHHTLIPSFHYYILLYAHSPSSLSITASRSIYPSSPPTPHFSSIITFVTDTLPPHQPHADTLPPPPLPWPLLLLLLLFHTRTLLLIICTPHPFLHNYLLL